MKLLVTGSNGQLGREIQKQVQGNPDITFVGVDIDVLDIGDLNAVQAFVNETRPDVCINCAAMTNVNLCETEVDMAFRANALGPRNLAIACEAVGAKIIHISTDYVFDGFGIPDKEGQLRPYDEFDAPAPGTGYGRSKLAGEQFVRDFCSKWFIVRTAWLYGDGNNFVRTMVKAAATRDEVKVVNDQFGTPTSTRALAKLILELAPTAAYGLYHGTCEGICTWYDFTREIYRLKGLTTTVTPCTTDEFPSPARRPAWSVLDNRMARLNGFSAFPQWEEEIAAYIQGGNA